MSCHGAGRWARTARYSGCSKKPWRGGILAEPVGEAGHGVEPAPVDGERAHAVEGRGLPVDGAGGRPGGAPGELVLADLVRGERGGPRGAAEERGEMGGATGRLCGACSRVWPRRRDGAPCAGCGRGVGLGGARSCLETLVGGSWAAPWAGGVRLPPPPGPSPRSGAGRPAHPYAVVRRTRRRGGAMRGPAVRTGWGRRRAGTACACCAR